MLHVRIAKKERKICTMIDYLKSKGIVSERDVPVVLYGLKLLLITLVEFVSVIVLAIWCGNFWEGIFFLLGFCPLRLYTGGYHAKTPTRCYFIMVVVYVIFSFLLVLIPIEMYRLFELIVGIFTFCTIYRFAPIIHENKMTYPDELYRRISINICLMDLLLLIVSTLVMPTNVYGFSFSLGIATVSFFIAVVIVKSAIKERGRRK